ncbi:MAG: monovalent cation/H(+) antiporter subunit G [Candidatus Sumerlaeia bacterium]|nr:monovalent cation/H(+) antiporter subunit G [Candidatus Sumerlaeia bacterium]
MSELLGAALIVLGTVFTAIAALGMLRFPDVYLRLQAASKGLTFGFCAIVLGAGLLADDPDVLAKAFVAVLFQFITSPLAGYLVARAAVRSGVKPATPLKFSPVPPHRLAADQSEEGTASAEDV